MMFQIKLLNQRKALLLFFACLVVVAGFIFSINVFFPQTASTHFILITLPAGIILSGLGYLTEKVAGELSEVTINSDGMTVLNQQTGQSKGLLFSELVKYRVLSSFGGRAALRLIAKDGTQLALRSAVSPEFTALLKEFDVACLRYVRQSGRKLTRVDMA